MQLSALDLKTNELITLIVEFPDDTALLSQQLLEFNRRHTYRLGK